MWSKEGPIVVGARVADWRGDTDANGEPMPPGTMAALSLDTKSRTGRVWAYDPAHGDTFVDFTFDSIGYEEGTRGQLYQGRFNPQGKPSLFFHGGQLKFIVPAWPGPDGGAAPLLRGYTQVFWR